MIRAALAAVLLAAGPGAARATDCDPARIGYAASALGVDYRARFPAPLAGILSQGEAEHLAARRAAGNPPGPEDRARVRDFWLDALDLMFAGRLAPGFTGAASEPSFDLFRATAPQMLARLRECGPAADGRLTYLRDAPLETEGPVE